MNLEQFDFGRIIDLDSEILGRVQIDYFGPSVEWYGIQFSTGSTVAAG